MNILLIPSWFPSERNPMAGSFIAEQAKAMSEFSDINVVVSLWGQASLEIVPRRPSSFFSFFKAGRAKKNFVKRTGSFSEAYSPAVYWSHRLPFGGARRLYKANIGNFYTACDRLGGIDLIHAHVSYPAGRLAELLSKKTGVPYVLTEHMGPFPFPSLLRQDTLIPEVDSAFRNAARVIAVSPSQALLMERFGIRRPIVIPNFVDEREFRCGEPGKGKFVFLTVCSITTKKGVGDLLEAIALWRPSSAEVEFRIVGHGPDIHKFTALSEQLGVSDLVKWYGVVSRGEIANFFRSCHVFVMPSHHESFGMVYAEAIACGKPVIATRCGGGEFIVRDGLNGRLVDVEDVGALARVMKDVYIGWHSYLPSLIRADFMERFSRLEVSRSIKKIYEEVISEKRSK